MLSITAEGDSRLQSLLNAPNASLFNAIPDRSWGRLALWPVNVSAICKMPNSSEFKTELTLQGLSEKTADPQTHSLDEARQRRGSFWRNLQRYIWDDPAKPVYEKKFLLKLDFFLLTYTCLGYFCKNL